ncbi:MAG: L17 family ribosomal protein [Candidatus Shapirobacteria bacterium]|nr:L17 family ribosomal protein [Candidatus Shapirobacteria bacterium]
MRHRIFGKKLGRNHNERKALFKSLTKGMFINGSINTTKAKVQAVVSIIESLSNTIITKPELIAKRELFKIFQNQTWVNNIVKTFKEVFGNQTSNFTKITQIKRRYGDDALIVKLSFVKPIKFEQKKEVKVEDKKTTKKPVKKQNKKILSKVEGKKETK